jgi:ATP-dependent RNA helicase RhlE
VPEDYVHRIGRTARAGQTGQTVSLVCVDEHKLLNEIERRLQTRISKQTITGYEPDPRIKAEFIGRAQHSFTHKKSWRRVGSPRQGAASPPEVAPTHVRRKN